MTDSNGNNAQYAAQKNNSHMVELLLATKTQLAYSRNEDGQPRCTSPRSTARRTLSRRCSGTAPT
jgi:hypothetical protein